MHSHALIYDLREILIPPGCFHDSVLVAAIPSYPATCERGNARESLWRASPRCQLEAGALQVDLREGVHVGV